MVKTLKKAVKWYGAVVSRVYSIELRGNEQNSALSDYLKYLA